VSELVFLYSADADIQAAFEYYESYQPGHGSLFLIQLDAALSYLRAFPESAPLFAARYRRRLVRVYPYGIFYVIEGNRIIIAHIMDLRQHPENILRKLSE
jgi:toxin ParE1/3/4